MWETETTTHKHQNHSGALKHTEVNLLVASECCYIHVLLCSTATEF